MRIRYLSMLVLLVLAVFASPALSGDDVKPSEEKQETVETWKDKVVVVPVKGVILPQFSTLQEDVEKAFERIEKEKPRLVVVEVDSLGGEVNTCDEIRKTIMDCSVPTVSLVLKNAISGGAMIATASKEVVMLEGGRIGDIQPMSAAGQPLTDRQAEKVETFVRSIMASTAEVNQYPKRILEAMVSRDIELYEVVFKDDSREFMTVKEVSLLEENIKEGRDKRKIKLKNLVVEEGKLLTLASQEAKKYGVAKEVYKSLEKFYEERGIEDEDVIRSQVAEGKIDLDKVLAALSTGKMMLLAAFLILGIAGALTEAYAPGFSIPGAVSIIGFASFFAVLFLAGRAEPFEIALFIIGIIFLVVEVVVLPGFGVAGLLGVLCVLASVSLAFFPPFESVRWQTHAWDEAGSLVLLAFGVLLAASLFAYWLVTYGSKLPVFKSMFLDSELRTGREVLAEVKTEENSTSEEHAREINPNAALVGQKGIATTPLRPSGKVRLDDGGLIDVITEGRLLAIDSRVIVIDTSMNRIVVGPDSEA